MPLVGACQAGAAMPARHSRGETAGGPSNSDERSPDAGERPARAGEGRRRRPSLPLQGKKHIQRPPRRWTAPGQRRNLPRRAARSPRTSCESRTVEDEMCCEFEEMAVHLARKARRTGGVESPLVRSLTKLIARQPGGLSALAARFDDAGLGRQMRSWIGGPGEKLSLPVCALRGALGEALYDKLVRRLDLDPADAAEVLAEILPLAVDRMTPEGRIEAVAPQPPVRALLARLAGALGA
ncbi:MAG: YidB family protein [Comamonadaceae bacterium]|nr:YidB family protein [Comamonadaceae bacterium]